MQTGIFVQFNIEKGGEGRDVLYLGEVSEEVSDQPWTKGATSTYCPIPKFKGTLG